MRYHMTLDLPRPKARQPVRQGHRRHLHRCVSRPRASAADDSRRRRLGLGLRRPRHVGPAQRHADGRRNDRLVFDDGAGYHDHNWGFWKDVSWRWGQVQHGDLSLVYGRIRPPADAADAERIPGFLAAIGPDGPVGYATNVSIEETNDPATGRPRSITVTGRSSSLDMAMELTVDNTLVTKTRQRPVRRRVGFSSASDDVTAFAAAPATASIDFTAAGAAETFRGR